MATVRIETKRIVDWPTFHQVFQEALGFPDFYGRNMDAWIDCLSCLGDGDGMTRFSLQNEEMLSLQIEDTTDFVTRLPELFLKMVQCAAFVNARSSHDPRLALVFVE